MVKLQLFTEKLILNKIKIFLFYLGGRNRLSCYIFERSRENTGKNSFIHNFLKRILAHKVTNLFDIYLSYFKIAKKLLLVFT